MSRDLKKTTHTIRTLDDARRLANELSLLCPNPPVVAIGLAELLFNAVEHGNLGITYEEKSKLQERDQWLPELKRRLNLPENLDKRVTVQMYRVDEEIHFLIQDLGDGFDWHPYMDIDPDRNTHSHGRGIAVARFMSFSHMEYLNNGNTVLAVVDLSDNTDSMKNIEPETEGRRRIKRISEDRRHARAKVPVDRRGARSRKK